MSLSLSAKGRYSFTRRVCVGAVTLVVVAGGLTACGKTASQDAAQEKVDAAATQAAAVATQAEEALAKASEAAKDLKDVKADNHKIVFEVTSSSATTADITITTLDANGNLSQEQKTDEPLPFTKTVEVDGSVVLDASNANMLVQAKDGEDITATLTIDDQAPVTSTGSGPFASTIVQGASK